MIRRIAYCLFALALTTLTVGCFDSIFGTNSHGSAKIFVYLTDYQSGALVSWEAGAAAVSELPYPGLHTDVALRSRGNRVYLLERFGRDAVVVIDADAPDAAYANYSVGNGTNLQDIAVAGSDRAYVIRLGSPRVLVIDPTDGDSLASIDLSSLADADGKPEAVAAVLSGSRLYVVLQLLDVRTMFWDPTGPGKVVAINTSNNTIADVYTLTVWNPGSIVAAGENLYVAGGPYGDLDKTGIDRLNTETKQVTRITEGTALGGRPNALARVPGELTAWTSVSQAWPNGKVFKIDLASGAIAKTLAEPVSPSGIAVGADTLLIVCDRKMNAPGIYAYNAKTGARSDGPIATPLPPDAAIVIE